MPLILATTDNPKSGIVYADLTGSSYEYPKMYSQLVQEGESFIYYRPGEGHRYYFGSGVVGAVARSPNHPNRLVCGIASYTPFPLLVPLQDDRGQYYEDTSPGPIFRNGVRSITTHRFNRILEEAER